MHQMRKQWVYSGFVVSLFVWSLTVPALEANQTPRPATANRVPDPISLRVSALAIDEATVTVSVLQDPLSPMKTILRLCQSDTFRELNPEEAETSDQLQQFCQSVDGLTNSLETPSHSLEPDEYLVTVPLKAPQNGLRAVFWKTQTLNDAIAFVELIQGGKLKALTVYASYPWSSDKTSKCSQCPIKDLVFDAGRLKDQQGILNHGSGRPAVR